MTRIALALLLSALAPAVVAQDVLLRCHFDTACGAESGCVAADIALEVQRDENAARWLVGSDAKVRVLRFTDGPITVFSGTGYEPDTGEDGGFTALVAHDTGQAVLLSAVALPLGDGVLEAAQFLGRCDGDAAE